jgi:23S rRNA (uridine2552-2'-O)-methyltransferase
MSCKKKHSSWLARQRKDPYVARSKENGYRSRASFKLLELNQSDKLFKPGMCVVDLGAAPGGWSQILTPLLGKKGRVIALDLLVMPELPNVEFMQGDFRSPEIRAELSASIAGQPVDWVLSDMAPNLSGMMSVDQPRIMELAFEAWDFAEQVLSQGGGFLVKVFQGEEIKPFVKILSQHFQKVSVRKPAASRSESREIFIVAKQFKRRVDKAK